jgi:hypothetical protein
VCVSSAYVGPASPQTPLACPVCVDGCVCVCVFNL